MWNKTNNNQINKTHIQKKEGKKRAVAVVGTRNENLNTSQDKVLCGSGNARCTTAVMASNSYSLIIVKR